MIVPEWQFSWDGTNSDNTKKLLTRDINIVMDYQHSDL